MDGNPRAGDSWARGRELAARWYRPIGEADSWRATAVEWGRDNIRVNALAPFGGPAENLDANPFPKQFVEASPLGRYGDPETEIGHAIAFLATNTFITGRTLMIDGGTGMFR